MGEKKKNKGVLIGSISITSAVLLIVTAIGPSLVFDSDEPIKPQRPKKLWDIIVPDDYDTIQEAVENAKPGYRIFVKSGVYQSPKGFFSFPLNVDKSGLTIRGEDKNSTIISGRGIKTPVYIKADSVNFSGFTLKDNGVNGSLMQVYSNNCIVSNNTFISNDYFDGTEYGIVLYTAEQNTFSNNYITGADKGLEIRGSNNNYIFNNTFENNFIAANIGDVYTVDFSRRFFDRVYLKPSVNNIFKNNTFRANYEGIDIDYSNNNQFLNNYFDSQISGGLVLSQSSNNLISNNVFIDDGLEIWGEELAHYNHEIKDNIVNGKPLYYYNKKNNIRAAEDAGQIIVVDCHNLQIERTKISKTTIAILIAFSTNILVRYNELSSNFRGVYLFYSTQCTISKNNFIKNTISAYFISYGFLNSRKNRWVSNYWDDWLGTKSFLFSFTNKRIRGRFHRGGLFNIIEPLLFGYPTQNVDRWPVKNPYSY